MSLVVGATGSLGRKITAELLARGENIRALVRPGKSPALPDRTRQETRPTCHATC